MGKLRVQKKRKLLAECLARTQNENEKSPVAGVLHSESLNTTLEYLTSLTKNPNLLKSIQLQPLRRLLHQLGNPKGSVISQITDALCEARWSDAQSLFVSLETIPKLGALQRWVRFCDAANGKNGRDPVVLRVLDSIMRTVRDSKGASPPHSINPLNILPDFVPVSFSNTLVFDPVSLTSETQILKSAKFKLIHSEGPLERKPENKYPLKMYLSSSNIVNWTNVNPAQRIDIPNVPGAFVLTNVLDQNECLQFLEACESIGFTPDEPTHSNSVLAHNMFWMANTELIDMIFNRIKTLIPTVLDGCHVLGLNRRMRIYRYVAGAIYRPHIDGSWPCSSVSPDGTYIYDSKNGRSKLTFLIYLNEDFRGGETTFFVSNPCVNGQMNSVAVVPRTGCVTVFPHGVAEGSLLHEGSRVEGTGTKYIIRTEVLYTCDRYETDE